MTDEINVFSLLCDLCIICMNRVHSSFSSCERCCFHV